MASIQRSSEKGWRIYWRLYFPDGTNKEKYKTSHSKSILQEFLPDIMRLETLSRHRDVIGEDLIRAINLKLISKEEASAFGTPLPEYPDPPPPMVKPRPDGIGMPIISGIYFVWEKGEIVYVGQSIDLNARVRLGRRHHAVYEDDMLSFVQMDRNNLLWAECHYIGLLKPKRNKK